MAVIILKLHARLLLSTVDHSLGGLSSSSLTDRLGYNLKIKSSSNVLLVIALSYLHVRLHALLNSVVMLQPQICNNASKILTELTELLSKPLK